MSSRYLTVDRLSVEIHPDRRAMARAAARACAAYLEGILARRHEARVMFACAPSQDEFLAAFADPAQSGVTLDWSRISAFHMDEYVGLAESHPQSFRHYLRVHLLERAGLERFHFLQADGSDPAEAARVYAQKLAAGPLDLICLGIGENGHIAFNDPAVADFDDPALVKVVTLDDACRRQQVNDGCFPSIRDVPRQALTVTIPVFRQARRLSVQVPGPRKSAAIRATLQGPIETACPASILRTHPAATLYIDADAASLL